MTEKHIIQQLARNKNVIRYHLGYAEEEEYRWKPSPDEWSLIEVLCHLRDEEKEDFRAMIESIWQDPKKPLPKIDPQGWVKERDYLAQDMEVELFTYMEARDKSIEWLESLKNADWNAAYDHPKYGPMSARMFLVNWLAHDYLHIRQIVCIKHQYLTEFGKEVMKYAGDW